MGTEASGIHAALVLAQEGYSLLKVLKVAMHIRPDTSLRIQSACTIVGNINAQLCLQVLVGSVTITSMISAPKTCERQCSSMHTGSWAPAVDLDAHCTGKVNSWCP
jgi:hypothetical protein